MMISITGWVLPTFGAMLTVLLLTSGIYFHREGSLLGSRILVPGGIIFFTLLFEALALLSAGRSEAHYWASAWFLAFSLYLPSLIYYLGFIEERDPRPSPRTRTGILLSLADLLVIAAGLSGFVAMVGRLAEAPGSLTLPLVFSGIPWYFGYFAVRTVFRLHTAGRILFARVKRKSAQWRRIIWFSVTALLFFLPMTDLAAAAGLPVPPAGQLFFAALFVSLYAGVRYRFLFRVSARYAAEEILTTMPDPLFVCDMDGHIQVVNDAFCTVFKYRREEVLGHNLFFTSNRENRRVVHEVVQKKEETRFERTLYDRNGEAVQTEISVSRLRDRDGALTGLIVAVQDIRAYRSALASLEELYRRTEAVVEERTRELQEANLALKSEIASRREAQERLHHAAYHDGLTGLPNREMFTERLQQVFSKFVHRGGGAFALLFIDLDRFKLINDSLGHLAGDIVLRETADRLRNCLRDVDTIGRLGGDEFVVLLEDIEGSHDAVTAADRIIESMRVAIPVEIEGRVQEVNTTVSIGISISGSGCTAAEELLRDADFALYRAKEAGKNRYALFDGEVQEDVLELIRVERELRVALREEQLDIRYQPIIDLESRRLTGFEALVRWNHPAKGELSPAAFIPVAEQSDLIVEIDRWVLSRACADLAAWHASMEAGKAGSPAAPAPTVSVNISARHLADGRLLNDIRGALEASSLPPSALIVEITESAIIRNLNAAREILQKVKDMGVGLHLDDFGEGYSSVNLLRTVPFDGMKIDKAYVTGIKSGQAGGRLLRTIIELGHSMEKSVIAEGIEHSDEADMLKEFSCEHGQGYLFSRPLPSSEVPLLLSGAESGTPCRVF